jgi:hypothetical protein
VRVIPKLDSEIDDFCYVVFASLLNPFALDLEPDELGFLGLLIADYCPSETHRSLILFQANTLPKSKA